MADAAAPVQNETVQATTSADTPDPAKAIRAQSADGVIHEFPAGTQRSVIDRVMKEYAQKQRGVATDTEVQQAQKQVTTFQPKSASEREGIYRATVGPEGDQGPQAYLAQQQALEKKLRAAGKTDEQIQADPEWQRISKALAQSESAVGTRGAAGNAIGLAGADALSEIAVPRVLRAIRHPIQTAEDVGRGIGKVLGKLPGAQTVKAAASKAPQVAEQAAKSSAEDLRRAATQTAEKGAAAQEAEAKTAESHAERIDRIRKQLQEQQPKVAAQRAEQRKLGPDLTRQRVLAQTRERARQAEADYRAAGATAQQAKDLVIEREARTKAAEDAATALDAQIAARPTTTAEQFGQMIRNATKSISDRYSKIRKRESGFTEAITSAGNKPIVSTKDIVDLIDTKMKNLRNPTLRNTLVDLRSELLTDDAEKLNIEAAESLRGTLDSIIGSKMFKDRKVDKETLQIVSQIRKELVNQASEAWKPYKEALAKWRQLSRPLDIVERKGALKKVLDVDPVSTDYANTEAQVVGEVIRKAQQGNPVFERLLQESPELKDAARLYFSKDLIESGANGSEAKLATWLKANERPLQQLGLTSEFKDIQSAKKAAQFAVDEAKGLHTAAVKEAKAAVQKEIEAARQQRVTETVRKMAKARAETNPTAEVTQRNVVPRNSLEAKETPKQAAGRLETQAGKLRATAEQKRAVVDDFKRFRTQLGEARPDEVPTLAKSLARQWADKGYITNTQYKDYLRQVKQVEDAFAASKKAAADKEKAQRRLIRLAGALALPYLGYEAYRGLMMITGRH